MRRLCSPHSKMHLIASQDARPNSQTLKKAMAAVGQRLNDDEALRLVKSFDTDANGSIDYHEFVEG